MCWQPTELSTVTAVKGGHPAKMTPKTLCGKLINITNNLRVATECLKKSLELFLCSGFLSLLHSNKVHGCLEQGVLSWTQQEEIYGLIKRRLNCLGRTCSTVWCKKDAAYRRENIIPKLERGGWRIPEFITVSYRK